jgi:hypothetical protein
MYQKNIFLALSAIILCISPAAKADLAEAMECHKNLNDKTCSAILIGHIDSLSSAGGYCADGKTSYGFLQQAWARDVSKDENLLKLGTSLSMRMTIAKLNLSCNK